MKSLDLSFLKITLIVIIWTVREITVQSFCYIPVIFIIEFSM